MARPVKKGLNYFPFDVDFFEDIKIRKLKKYCGNQSIPVLVAILCYIFRGEGYFVGIDSDFVFLIAEQFGVSEGFVEDAVRKMVEVEYFDSHQFHINNILTSKRIQEIYFSAVSERKEVEVHAIFVLIDINRYNNLVILPINSVNRPDNQQRKEKERKEKESKVNNKGNTTKDITTYIDSLEVSERMKERLISFSDMRKSIKKPLTVNALKLIVNRIKKLSEKEEEQIEILENSIMNCWQGVFPLKGESNGKSNRLSSNDKETKRDTKRDTKYDHLYSNL